EYAARFIKKVEEMQIPYVTDTMVLDISSDKVVTAISKADGLYQIEAGAVILAMGCRERPRGALNIPGTRPAGIYTAGTAQRLVNMEGYMPGKEIVILGSGDIGLIMARRLTLEGATVKVVAELMPYSGGLKRNIVQCLNDFNIPLKLSHTVVDIKGHDRVEAVTIAEVDENRKPIPGTEETYSCDTLLLSCGLIPENELSKNMGVSLNRITNGPIVDSSLETNIPGVFACGNVLHVHDLVDYVSAEAAKAGQYAALYLKRELPENAESDLIHVDTANGVRYCVPTHINPARIHEDTILRFRVGAVMQNVYVSLYLNGKRTIRKKRPIVAPGEMEELKLTVAMLEEAGPIESILITIEKE
ncbi:MAG: FAD-dependent oxidoreductase, partial [Lachnospiraceae bacterium]|nr:FAD-dependent oxidoreductase [Lachnospiraceae bacterium]